MEQKMDALVNAVESLSTKSAIDYLMVIVPIVISLVAIVISVCAARKQNKIALFEKRYEALTWIQSMLSFSEGIYDGGNKLVILCVFDGYFGTNLCDKSDDDRFIEAMARVERLKHDVLQVKFLFPFEYDTDLEKIVNHLKEYILALIYDQDYVSSRESFCQMCKEFYKSDFKRMVNILAIR